MKVKNEHQGGKGVQQPPHYRSLTLGGPRFGLDH